MLITATSTGVSCCSRSRWRWGLTSTPRASAAPPGSVPSLTNLAHLDFLLDDVSPGPVAGHTTYRLGAEPNLIMPWTYADARTGGTFERIGGGTLDPATGDYGQGAFNADDTARAAVVYLRHWRQTGDRSSRRSAYELLRSVAYHQTISGPHAGNVVLWMQADGELNPSADPVELPDPSDSEAELLVGPDHLGVRRGLCRLPTLGPGLRRLPPGADAAGCPGRRAAGADPLRPLPDRRRRTGARLADRRRRRRHRRGRARSRCVRRGSAW